VRSRPQGVKLNSLPQWFVRKKASDGLWGNAAAPPGFGRVHLFGPGLLKYRSNVLGCLYFINHFRLMVFQDCVAYEGAYMHF
jgi:hypothetical protein